MQNCKVSGVKYAVAVERTYSTLRSPNNPAKFAASSHITLDEIKRTFPILSEQNKHLYITRNTQEAAQVLMSMYNSLSDLNPVKHYIKTYCLHLLSWESLVQKSNLPGDFLDYEVERVSCAKRYATDKGSNTKHTSSEKIKKGHPSLYKFFDRYRHISIKKAAELGKAGCYIFLNLINNQYYIGSAICLNSRYKNHKVNSVRPDRGGDNVLYLAVRELGWRCFIWKPLILTTNHINNFVSHNPGYELDLESLFILRAFTQFEVRVYEQALLTHFSRLRLLN